VKDAAAVFVHGLFSSSETWKPLITLLEASDEITASYDLIAFEYDSPKWRFNPTRRIPDFPLVARSLKTFLEMRCAEYRTVVLITHSQGGLVAQRYLTEMLDDGQGRELARISRVILLACPNNGAEFALLLRRSIGRFWSHPQERALRPYQDDVANTHRRVMTRVVNAATVSSDSCPIEFRVYAGESDNIVTPASARSTFPEYGALPGDHNSILKADSVKHLTYITLKTNLLQVVRDSPRIPRFVLKNSSPIVSDGDSLEDSRPPLVKITRSLNRLGSTTSSEMEIFDPSLADRYIRQNLTSREGADGDG
jgi:pimeloyl-ACP methyl ester carboxylesterase